MRAHGRRRRRSEPGRSSRALRLLGLAIALAFGVLGGPGTGPAAAHAYLIVSSPVDGQSFAASPNQLRLEFSEHVVLESTRIVLTDASGRAQPLTRMRAEAEDAAPADPAEQAAGVVDTEEPLAVVADLPRLRDGAYHVTWETLSSDDLHRTAGGFAFGVNTAVVADSSTGVAGTRPDLSDAFWRAVVLAGLGLALGASLVSRLATAGRDAASAPGLGGRLRRVGIAAAVGAVVAGAIGLAIEVAEVGGPALSGWYVTRWGLRESALLALTLALARRARPVSAVAAGFGASVGTALLGHTGLRGGVTWTVASAIHVCAGAAWCGAVVLIAWIALRHRRAGATDDLRAVARGFFRPATVLVAAVAVTGLYLAGDTVVSVDAAIGTTYGRVLLAKVAVSATIGALAASTARRLHRRRDDRVGPFETTTDDVPTSGPAGAARGIEGRSMPRRRIALEAGGLGVALLLAAVLASGQPAISPALVDRTGRAPSVILDRTAGQLQETLAIAPNHPGDSVVTVDVFDARRPSPGPVTAVSVLVPTRARSARVAARAVGNHRWVVGVRLPASGPTPIGVTVHRQGLPATTTTFDWVVGPTTAAAPPVVSRAPISAPLQIGALCLLVVILLLGGRAGWRHRKNRSAVHGAAGGPPSATAVRPARARTP